MGLDQFLEKNGEVVISWRKENHLQHWFIINTDYDEDTQKPSSPFKVSKLKQLVNVLKQVYDNHELAEDLMSTRNGFFYGSTDYSEYYFSCINREIRELKELIKNHKKGDTYTYGAWY